MTTSIAKKDGTEGEMVRYQSLDPVGNKKTLADLLEKQMPALRQVLPKHVTAERLVKTMMLAINKQPDLLLCTQESVLNGVAVAAELGLDLSGTLGEAYLIPFNNKLKINGKEVWKKQATFIAGYRGLARLARQSGEVGRIESEVIYERDMEVDPKTGEPGFIYQKGTDFKLRYRPYLGEDKGKPVGAYSLVELKGAGFQADFMTTAQIERTRNISKSKNGSAWTNHWDEMAKKTVFRRLAKWLPLSGERWQKVLEVDSEDFDMAQMVQDVAVVEEGPRTESLAAKLKNGKHDEVKDLPKESEAVLSPESVEKIREGLRNNSKITEAALCLALGHEGLTLDQLPPHVFNKAMGLVGNPS